jgi:hypothetical protein
MPPKTSTNEEDDDPSLKKGKEKVLERTPTPEPPDRNHGMDPHLLRLLLGGRLEAAERKYRSLPYPPPGVKNIRGHATDDEDHDDPDFVPPKWHRRRDLYASRFMPSLRAPSRRPLPEFVIGPSRITLDDFLESWR